MPTRRMEEVKKELEKIAHRMQPWIGTGRSGLEITHHETNIEYISKSVGELSKAILLLMEAMEERPVEDLMTLAPIDPIDMTTLGPEILGREVYDVLHPEAMEGEKGEV